MFDNKATYRVSKYNVAEQLPSGDLLLMNMRTEECIKLTGSFASWYLERVQENSFQMNFGTVLNRLVDGGFIISDQFDESKWVELKHRETLYGSDILAITLMPTNDCNFRCAYCYQTPTPVYMDETVEKRIIRFFERKVPHTKKVRVSWFGGEPLLNREQTCRMASAINEICKKNHVPLISTINTNGYNLDVDTFKYLVSCRLLEYEVCLDGPPDIHNKMRPHKDNPDSFSTILNNLINIQRYVKTKTFEVTLRCNVASGTVNRLDEYLSILAKYFAYDSRFRVYFQGVRDWGGNRINQKDIPENENSINKLWYDKAVRCGLKSAEAFSLAPFAGYCEANRKNGYIINCDGSLHKCTIAMYSKYADLDAIGYIDEYGREVIDEGKIAQWMIEEKPLQDRCKKCKMFPICVGNSCPFRINIEKQYKCNNLEEVAKAKLRCMDYLNLFSEKDVI